MKTVLFLNSNPFAVYMFNGFIEQKHESIDHVFIFPFKNKQQTTFQQYRFFFLLYGFLGFIKKTIQLIKLKYSRKKYKNLIDLLSKNNICYEFIDDPNSISLETKLLKLAPDIIFAALPQIIPNNILNIPKIGIFNKHSSLTPNYKGVYPVFWQMLKKESKMGITIHKMNKKIDQGEILIQKSYKLHLSNSLDKNYWILINKTSEVIIEAFDLLESNEYQLITPEEKGSYFSFPQRKDIKEFKSYGLKII
jgi:hypothetical protein